MTTQLVRNRVAPVNHRDEVPTIEISPDPIPDQPPRRHPYAVAVLVGILAVVATVVLYRPTTTVAAAAVPRPTVAAVHVFRVLPAGADSQSDGNNTSTLADGDIRSDGTFMLVVVLGPHATCEIDVDGHLADRETAMAGAGYVDCIWTRPSVDQGQSNG